VDVVNETADGSSIRGACADRVTVEKKSETTMIVDIISKRVWARILPLLTGLVAQ
jgi:hypothetical protein